MKYRLKCSTIRAHNRNRYRGKRVEIGKKCIQSFMEVNFVNGIIIFAEQRRFWTILRFFLVHEFHGAIPVQRRQLGKHASKIVTTSVIESENVSCKHILSLSLM